ncbi:hypothetical protein PspLS_05042 [Pyricularia sp. CBS 133598]|nr:hypothetical protein PspLS_05042 [Pyricularia sp. CBS 133598]
MASFGRTSSPVLTMPLQSPFQSPFGRPPFTHQSSSLSQSAPWANALAQNTAQAPRGRKRSRDEAAVNLDSPEKVPPPVVTPQEDEDEWEYGPGMILIKKNSRYVNDASTQSGTWIEEQKARDEARKLEEALALQQQQAQERPSLRSHKSSRLDMSSVTLSARADSSPVRSSPGRDVSDPSSATDSPAQPVVDDFTMHLGIGWGRISDALESAARGWAKYIENHYPLSNVVIRLESRGLESYLVQANEGYFLFAENLKQGRLVSQDPTRAFENLKASPPIFDSASIMTAAESPRPTQIESAATATGSRTDVQMDLS